MGLVMKITNHDLHIMLTRIDEKQTAIVEKVDSIIGRQALHQTNDDKQFAEVRFEINSMNKYAASIAIVAGGIGAISAYIWNKITGV